MNHPFRSIFILLLILLVNSLFADTLVYFNEVKFHSEFESKVFDGFFKDNDEDYFAVCISGDTAMNAIRFQTYKKQYNALVNDYKGDYYKKMKESKKIRKIFNGIHDQLLDKYVQNVFLTELFDSGYYHCLTGTMLYALVFRELDIPYEIHEIPEHVYLVAYPETHNTLVETTDPLHGAFTYDNYFKGNFVDYLRDSKLISKEEYNSKSVHELFQQYYYSEKTISLKELAGLQYYNDGLYALTNMDFEKAYHLFEKAYLFYPGEKISYFLFFSLSNIVDKLDYGRDDFAQFLFKLARYKDLGVSNNIIIGEFAVLTQKLLLYEGNVQQYDQSYQVLMENLKDSTLRSEIAFLYNYERGRILFNQMNNKEALPYTELAYVNKRLNVDAQQLFIRNLLKLLQPYGVSEEDFYFLNEYTDKYPELKENPLLNQARLSICLEIMNHSFYEGNKEKGEKYMAFFESEYPERIDNYTLLGYSIVQSYSSGAIYYYRRGNYTRSKEILLKGLEYVPGNIELETRLQAIN